MWQSVWLSVLSCGSVCRSCVTVIARLASTHTALVSQSLVGLCFAFPSINQSINQDDTKPPFLFSPAEKKKCRLDFFFAWCEKNGAVCNREWARVQFQWDFF